MTTARSANALATAALLLAAVTACSGDPEQTSPSEPPTSAASSSTPTNSATLTVSEGAARAASQVVRDYFSTVDRLRQNPDQSPMELNSVATGIQLAAQKALMRDQRTAGYRQHGDTEIVDLSVELVNLDNSDPTAGKVPVVQVDVCWDVSDVYVVDATGASVVGADRKPRAWTRYTVANYDWEGDPDDGWRVANGQDMENTPCVAP